MRYDYMCVIRHVLDVSTLTLRTLKPPHAEKILDFAKLIDRSEVAIVLNMLRIIYVGRLSHFVRASAEVRCQI